MRRASLYRMSGNSLMISAVLYALAMVLLPRARASTIAEATSLVGAGWIAAGVLAILAAVLSLTAMIGVYRHFLDTEHEPWALLALGGAICGAVLSALGGALAALGQPLLLAAASGAAPGAYDPAQAVLMTLFSTSIIVSGTLMWLSLLAFGVAMLGDPAWPRWIVRGAAVVGAIEAIIPFVLIGQPMLFRLVAILGFAYLVFLGNAITRIPKTAAARAQQPPVTV